MLNQFLFINQDCSLSTIEYAIKRLSIAEKTDGGWTVIEFHGLRLGRWNKLDSEASAIGTTKMLVHLTLLKVLLLCSQTSIRSHLHR